MFTYIKKALRPKELRRWVVYSLVFIALLMLVSPFTTMETFVAGSILGFFAGALNRIDEQLTRVQQQLAKLNGEG
jgi:hypothetical protein